MNNPYEKENSKEGVQDEWATVMEALAKHDHYMVQSGKEGIDSLLVFVCGFSMSSKS